MSSDRYFFDCHDTVDLLEQFSGKTGLQSAAMLGQHDPVPALLATGQSFLDTNQYGNNAAHIASFADQHEFLEKIPDRILDQVKNSQNKNNESPLMVAINEHSETSARLWINRGTDLSLTDKDGNDAYALAESTGQTKLQSFIADREEAFGPR